MQRLVTLLASTGALFAAASHAGPIDVGLGSAASFAVLAGATVTNTGATTIIGNLGVWPGSQITGFPPGIVTNGSIYAADTVAMQAQADLTTAYNEAAAETCGANLSGQNLGGMTLTPGVYCFSSAAQLTGTLNLNGLNNPNAVFVFEIASALTTASSSFVDLINDAEGGHIYWQVGSSATLGTTTDFAGTILALSSITLDTGAQITCGRALALTGAVTLDGNLVDTPAASCGPTPVPEPGSLMLLGTGFALAAAASWRKEKAFLFEKKKQKTFIG